MYFWGQKYQKPPHVVFRGIARTAALHGARKIRPMRHPVADAPAAPTTANVSGGDGIVTEEQVQKGYVWMTPMQKLTG